MAASSRLRSRQCPLEGGADGLAIELRQRLATPGLIRSYRTRSYSAGPVALAASVSGGSDRPKVAGGLRVNVPRFWRPVRRKFRRPLLARPPASQKSHEVSSTLRLLIFHETL